MFWACFFILILLKCHSAAKIIFLIYLDTSASKLFHWLLSGKPPWWKTCWQVHITYPSLWRPWSVDQFSPWTCFILYSFVMFAMYLEVVCCIIPLVDPGNLLLTLLSEVVSHFMFLQLQEQLAFNLDWHLWATPEHTQCTIGERTDNSFVSLITPALLSQHDHKLMINTRW